MVDQVVYRCVANPFIVNTVITSRIDATAFTVSSARLNKNDVDEGFFEKGSIEKVMEETLFK